MKRRTFIRDIALTTSALTFLPYFNLLGNPLAGKVKITDVKCVLTKIGMRVSPLVKITTDAGLVGIGECHHDENGLGAKDIVVVSPDKGAVERSTAFASFFGKDIPIVVFEKQRDVKTGEVVMVGNIPLKHKNVVIADDIISTGGTMANAIKLSKESGANKIYAVATHALMLQNAKYRILTAGADYIIGTDSIDNEVAVVSLAKTIASYLKFD